MLQIFFIIISTIFLLFFLGFGLTYLAIPPRLKEFSFWLIPWFTIVFLIFSLTILSLLNVPISKSAIPVALLLCFLNYYYLQKKTFSFKLLSKDRLVIFFFILISIVFNLSPILIKDRFPTVVTLGNHDIHAYVTSSEYLLDHTILESQQTKTPRGVGTLLQFGYRWGASIVSSFFIYLLKLKAYQFVTIFQILLYALLIPLLYIIFKLLYKISWLGLLFLSVHFIFNVNLLYMLYHNFVGQIFFWGFELILIIFFLDHFYSDEINKKSIIKYDILLSLTLSALFFTYPEGAIIIVLILCLYYFSRTLLNRKIQYVYSFIKLTLLLLLMSGVSVIYAIYFIIIYRHYDVTSAIGWQVFRQALPFANPFEVMGYYSIHSFEPMPIFAALCLSIIAIFFFIKGLMTIKKKLLVLSFFFIYFAFLIWSLFILHNFFVYNKFLTFYLPVIIVIFSVGFIEYLKKFNKMIKVSIYLSICFVLFFNALKLNSRFINEGLSIDKSLLSLKELNMVRNITVPIFSENFFNNNIPFWGQLWSEYFLSNHRIVTTFDYEVSPSKIKDSSLVLIALTPKHYYPIKILFDSIVWENSYYRLGRICNSDECLSKSNKDLSTVSFGKTEFDNSLLGRGWSLPEVDSRWVSSSEANIRLVNKTSTSKLIIKAHSLKTPQKIAISIDKKLISNIDISEDWRTYIVPIGNISSNTHLIGMKFSHGYRPSDVLGGSDTRVLYANFKEISLQ